MPRDCFRSFYTCSPPASSTGTLDAIRCERYTHALFKNREGPDSPTRRFAVWDLSVEMVSSLMTLIQNFNHYSFLLLFSAPPPRSLSLSPGRGFCAYIVFYHTEYFTKALLLAHIHTLPTFSRTCSHFHSLTLFTSVIFRALSPFFILPFFSGPLHLNLISSSFSSQCSSLSGTSAHSLFFFFTLLSLHLLSP